MKYTGILDNARVVFKGSDPRTMRFHAIIPPVQDGQGGDFDLGDDFNLSNAENIPAIILEQHAKAILVRAVFLLGWHIFRGVKFDLLDDDNNLIDCIIQFPGAQTENQIDKIRLNPIDIYNSAVAKGLYFSRPLLQAVCISINLGRHVILTGAPGSGKSKLAELICQEISKARGLNEEEGYRIVTASPAWSSGDVIGRYFPNHKNIIKFMPGFFLQAIRDDECLIIDEINRANIDECFGELFTVLAGQTVTLPFREYKDDGSVGEDEKIDKYAKSIQVTIIPTTDNNIKKQEINEDADEISPNFRLIGTMNDSDRTFLHKLSYALLRRFDVIRVDSPSKDDLENIAKGFIEKILPINNNELPWRFRVNNNINPNTIRNGLASCLERVRILFCADDNIIDMGVVGVSSIKEVFDYIHEGLSSSAGDQGHPLRLDCIGNNQDRVEAFGCTLATLALTLKVLPQLDAISDDCVFNSALNKLAGAASDSQYLQIKSDDQGTVACQLNPNRTCKSFFLDEAYKYHIGTSRGEVIQGLMR